MTCRTHLRALVDSPAGPVCPACARTFAEPLREQQRATLKAHAVEAGKKGGPARAAVLTPERRREISRMGNEARKARRA